MLEVTIYYKDGRRSYYDHVAQVTNFNSNDNLVLDFITDFNDHISKTLKAEEIERLGVKLV